MLEMMTTAPKWTLRPWKVTMENQLNSWSMYIPGVSSSNEVQEMKNFKDMIDAMTDEEVDDPLNKLNGPARERISRSTGRSMDEVTRLIIDTHDPAAFAPIAHLTVGGLRDWLLDFSTDNAVLATVAPGLTPEMAAAVAKLMRNQDLVAVARKREVVTKFRNTLGLSGRFSVRLQPNHPSDDPKGIAASIVDGLLYAAGDAVIGINPATDSPAATATLLNL